MKIFLLWSVFPMLFLCSFLIAQENKAATLIKTPKVKQGEQVVIQIKVTPAANVSGQLDVFVQPKASLRSEFMVDTRWVLVRQTCRNSD